MKQDKRSIDCSCKHHWISHGKTSYGKQRYKCTKCGITRVAFDEKTFRSIIDRNISILNTFDNVENGLYIWQNGLSRNPEIDVIEEIEQSQYYINQKEMSSKKFRRFIRENKILPLIAYGIKKEKLYVFKVTSYE